MPGKQHIASTGPVGIKKALREKGVFNKFYGEVLELLEQHACLFHADRLVAMGVDPEDLIRRIEFVHEVERHNASPYDDWKQTTGLELEDLELLIKKIESLAGMIGNINSRRFGLVLYSIPWGNRLETPVGARDLFDLPRNLRRYRECLQWFRDIGGPKKKRGFNQSRFLLTYIVIKKTRKPHDNEVAGLINAALERPDENPYSPDTHRAWRYRDYKKELRKFQQGEETYFLVQGPE